MQPSLVATLSVEKVSDAQDLTNRFDCKVKHDGPARRIAERSNKAWVSRMPQGLTQRPSKKLTPVRTTVPY